MTFALRESSHLAQKTHCVILVNTGILVLVWLSLSKNFEVNVLRHTIWTQAQIWSAGRDRILREAAWHPSNTVHIESTSTSFQD